MNADQTEMRMENDKSEIVLVVVGGILPVVGILAYSAWALRNAKERFSVLRVLRVTALILLWSLPFGTILVMWPPRDPGIHRALLLATALAPVVAATLVGFTRARRLERQKKLSPIESNSRG